MRGKICSVLRCPGCGGGEWRLSAEGQDYREIVSGSLTCRECRRAYAVQGGAVVFATDEELGELRRLDRERSSESDQRILEQKQRGNFMGDARQREDEYRRDTFERTEFLFQSIEYDAPHKRYVLDLGCGEPALAARFAKLGFNVIALDYTLPRLDLAHGYLERDGVYFERLLALMTRLPLRDQSVDLVFSHASLHHATPHRPEDFRWFDPHNLLDTLHEVRRVLKPDGLFLVSGEGVYPEELPDGDRWLEREAQQTGCYEAFYKLSEYEWAFREAGVPPNLWALSRDNRLLVGTFQGGHYRDLVTAEECVNTTSDLLLSAPALKRELDGCLGGWARVRPWPAGVRVPRTGGSLPMRDPGTFVRSWHQAEADPCGLARWMGREPAVIAFELDFVPTAWTLELELRACSILGAFKSAISVEQQGHVVARHVLPQTLAPASCPQELVTGAFLEAGPVAIRCVHDGQLRIAVGLNGDPLTTLDVPSDNEFHVLRIHLPVERVRALNQLTLTPSYALRPSDWDISPDDRWLSCFVRGVRLEIPPAEWPGGAKVTS